MTDDVQVIRLRSITVYCDRRNGTLTIAPRAVAGPRSVSLTLTAEEFEQHLLPLVTIPDPKPEAPPPF